jgi:hypothetical protein
MPSPALDCASIYVSCCVAFIWFHSTVACVHLWTWILHAAPSALWYRCIWFMLASATSFCRCRWAGDVEVPVLQYEQAGRAGCWSACCACCSVHVVGDLPVPVMGGATLRVPWHAAAASARAFCYDMDTFLPLYLFFFFLCQVQDCDVANLHTLYRCL